ncbi:MAG: hypothetical protein Q9222_001904 [Ikaeria aurantiellina]
MTFPDDEYKLESDSEAGSSARYSSSNRTSTSTSFNDNYLHQDKRPFEWKRKHSNAVLVITNAIILAAYLIVRCQSLAPKADIQRAFANMDSLGGHSVRPFKRADAVEGVQPIPCHSHNDEEHQKPLHDALDAGCISIEADVWLQDRDLLIGHSEDSLNPSKTLKSLYIEPIMQIIKDNNPDIDLSSIKASRDASPKGVFTANTSQPLILLIDVKTDSRDTIPVLMDQLSSLQSGGLLTHFNGRLIERPLTIVLSGNTAFNDLTSTAKEHDIFFDAPLDSLSSSSQYTAENSYYATANFDKAVGKASWLGDISDEQIGKLKEQIKVAYDKGLKARYWNTPGGAFEKHVEPAVERGRGCVECR